MAELSHTRIHCFLASIGLPGARSLPFFESNQCSTRQRAQFLVSLVNKSIISCNADEPLLGGSGRFSVLQHSTMRECRCWISAS
jgi:hypothetical protein